MKTPSHCDLNWIQECDGLGMIAKDRQAELEQSAFANRSDDSGLANQNRRTNRFLRAVFDFAMTLRYRIAPA